MTGMSVAGGALATVKHTHQFDPRDLAVAERHAAECDVPLWSCCYGCQQMVDIAAFVRALDLVRP